MLTRANLMWMALIVAGAFGLYHVKFRVQELQVELANVNRQIEEERENLHVVQAEWTYLSRPERVQALAKKYLNLQAIRTDQIATLDAVPLKSTALASATEENPPTTGASPAALRVNSTTNATTP